MKEIMEDNVMNAQIFEPLFILDIIVKEHKQNPLDYDFGRLSRKTKEQVLCYMVDRYNRFPCSYYKFNPNSLMYC